MILRPADGERYEVRQLATGKVVARGTAARDAVGVTGNLFLRETEQARRCRPLDVTTGREAWTRAADELHAARAPDGSLRLARASRTAG